MLKLQGKGYIWGGYTTYVCRALEGARSGASWKAVRAAFEVKILDLERESLRLQAALEDMRRCLKSCGCCKEERDPSTASQNSLREFCNSAQDHRALMRIQFLFS